MRKGGSGLSAKEMLQQVYMNSQLMTLLFSDSIKYTGMFAISALLTYYYKYVIGNLGMISVHLFCMSICSFLGSLIAPFIVKNSEKDPHIYLQHYLMLLFLQ